MVRVRGGPHPSRVGPRKLHPRTRHAFPSPDNGRGEVWPAVGGGGEKSAVAGAGTSGLLSREVVPSGALCAVTSGRHLRLSRPPAKLSFRAERDAPSPWANASPLHLPPRNCHSEWRPMSSRCVGEILCRAPEESSRGPSQARRAPPRLSLESPRRAACAHRGSARRPATRASAGHAARLAFTAEAHAARRGIEAGRSVGRAAGLSAGRGRFLGGPPGIGVDAVPARGPRSE